MSPTALVGGRCRPSAVREMHTVLSGAFKQAVVWGWTAHNPVKLATPPAAGRAEVAPPDADGVARLLVAAMDQDPELGLFLRLAVVLGARRSELVALKWREVDLGAGEVDLGAGEVLIASGVVRVAGQPLIDEDGISHRFQELAAQLGVRARLHDLRHFMVTQLVAGGVDWRTVSGRAGHADGHMTLATYAHFQQAQDRQAAEFMESLLAPAARPDAR